MSISLVTGGSGFIGQHLVGELIAAGEDVRVLDLEPPAREDANVTFIRGGVTDTRLVREAMEGVSHLYHAAALSDLWIADPRMFQEVNVVGTRIVLEAALKAGVERVVHTSSATVLIDRRIGRRPTTLDETFETGEKGLAGAYARSKWWAEKVATGFMDKMPIVIVLPTLPLGPGDRRLTPPSRMLQGFLSGKIGAYVDCILNLIDVRAAAVGHRLACARGRPGQRYILNNHSLEMSSFLQCLQRLTGRPMPTWRVPATAALVASAAMEFWSNQVSGRMPLAPLAGTRTSLQPVSFDGRLAQVELGLPITPVATTLNDAIVWLARTGHLPEEVEKTILAANGD
ncbi:MAG: NAD-dependent epimerase/dehydratase family protein [Geminicoccaceae bacterium]